MPVGEEEKEEGREVTGRGLDGALLRPFLPHIFECLDVREMMASAAGVCKSWNGWANSYSMWRLMLQRLYGHKLPFLPPERGQERAAFLLQWRSFFLYVFKVERFGR